MGLTSNNAPTALIAIAQSAMRAPPTIADIQNVHATCVK